MKKYLDVIMTHLAKEGLAPAKGSRWKGSERSFFYRTFNRGGAATYRIEVGAVTGQWIITYLRLMDTQRVNDERLNNI